METSAPPPLPIDLSASLYYQLVYTLTALLPPPVDDTPEGLRARNHTAIAKVAALLPVNANEADLAAQCIAARAQAEDVLRSLRRHSGDIALVMRLNAQYGSMVRTSLSVHARLMRVQALRQKREAIESSANEDAWALHIAERSMLKVVEPEARPRQPAPAEVPRPAPAAMPTEAQPADVDPLCQKHVPPDGTNSHDAAFETSARAQFRSRLFGQLDAGRPHQAVREAMAGSGPASRQLPANSRESPERAGQGGHIDGIDYAHMSGAGVPDLSPQAAQV